VPLIRYSEYIYYAGGNPAAGVSFRITLLGGNVAVPLFSDKAGTTPLANPVTADAEGRVMFFAAPGDYRTSLAGTNWLLPVDDAEPDPAWPGTFIHTQAVPAAVWTVDHHFGVQPSVTVLTSGQAVEADVTHSTGETTVITFGAPATGTAYLRR
jgi:hypothetical protein